MATIKAPNKEYTGRSASVAFAAGVGHTKDPNLIKWFKTHGYEVEKDRPAEPAKDKTPAEPAKDKTPAE